MLWNRLFQNSLNRLTIYYSTLGLLCLLTCLTASLPAQTAPKRSSSVALDTLVRANQLKIVWDIEWMGKEQIMFTELEGRIGMVDLKSRKKQYLYDFKATARELQAGLLGMALHPNFQEQPSVYVACNYYIGDQVAMRLVELRYDVTNKSLRLVQTLLDSIPSASVNTGGRVLISPDEKIFLTIGEGDDDEIAQNRSTLAGKIIRLNLDGSIPSDNPIPGSPIWSSGLRNPQGLTWGKGQLYCSEHGSLGHDEINRIVKNGDYGWPLVAGDCDDELSYQKDSCFIEPMLDWRSSVAPCGMAYYDGAIFGSAGNQLLVTSLKNQLLKVIKLDETGQKVMGEQSYLNRVCGRLRDVMVNPAGRIFVSTSNLDIYGDGREGGDQIVELVKSDRLVQSAASDDQSITRPIQLEKTELQVRVLAEKVYLPWDMVWGPDDWIWFSERGGAIRKIHPDNGEMKFIYQLPAVYESNDNSGTHGMVIHPNYPSEPYIYIHYTYELYESRLVRLKLDPKTEKVVELLVLMDKLKAHRTHNGSRLLFGPDGHLYFTLGDAYKKRLPLKPESPNGKILRMLPDGGIPEDNPFPGSRVWSVGHRNPQGLVWGPDGTLYSSEHGLVNDDEVNIIIKGGNYGWPKVQGRCDQRSERRFCRENEVIEPIFTWTPTVGISGIDFYNHPAIPEWQNSILACALKGGDGSIGQRIFLLRLNEAGTEVVESKEFLDHRFGRYRDVLVAPDGRVFVCTSNLDNNGQEPVTEFCDRIIELRAAK